MTEVEEYPVREPGTSVMCVRPMFQLMEDECVCKRPRKDLCSSVDAARWPVPFHGTDLDVLDRWSREHQALLASL